MRYVRPSLSVLSLAAAFLLNSACKDRTVLVEQFDNGPVGGPPGPSEGIRRVGINDLPPPGKSWIRVEKSAR